MDMPGADEKEKEQHYKVLYNGEIALREILHRLQRLR